MLGPGCVSFASRRASGYSVLMHRKPAPPIVSGVYGVCPFAVAGLGSQALGLAGAIRVRACVPGAPEKLRSTRLLCRKRRKTLLGEEDGMNLASIQGECE